MTWYTINFNILGWHHAAHSTDKTRHIITSTRITHPRLITHPVPALSLGSCVSVDISLLPTTTMPARRPINIERPSRLEPQNFPTRISICALTTQSPSLLTELWDLQNASQFILFFAYIIVIFSLLISLLSKFKASYCIMFILHLNLQIIVKVQLAIFFKTHINTNQSVV